MAIHISPDNDYLFVPRRGLMVFYRFIGQSLRWRLKPRLWAPLQSLPARASRRMT
jgi:hypothetical protein